PRIGGFHHHLFGDEACLCDCGSCGEHGSGSGNAKRKRVHFTILPSIVQALPTRRGGRSACQARGLMSIHNSYAAHPTHSQLPALQVWMAPAWQEIIWRAAQRSLAVMCPACWCSPGGLLALMGSANRVLIIRTGSMSR